MPSSAPYLNFDLLITRAGDRYRAIVVDAPGGDADIFFDLPPSLPSFQRLLALSGPRCGLCDTPTQTTPAASLNEVGRLLYEAIFQGEVRDVLVASQREAAENAAGLRLRLRFNQDAADLATLPWEILYDAGQERFLALSENLPILRYLSLPRPRPAPVTRPPLRILAVLTSPDGLDSLNLDGEWQALVKALSPLVDDGKVVLERLSSPTPSALQQRLLGDPVHVLHFVGHGVFDEESRQGMLVLADERNQPKLMGARELAMLLANHTSLRLLYLNACEGAMGDDVNVFAGLAQRLVQQGIPAAIAMQAEISDKAGINLARTFYTALATGRPVDAALTHARVTLAMNRSVEWATPVLFSRAPDNRLFDIRDVLPTPDCPYPGMKPFNEKQKEFFFGRDKEIDDAVNRLARHPFLAVVGPSGSGKSSLVYAGILPGLRASRRFGPGPWTVHTLRPGDSRTEEGKAAPMKALSQLGDLSPQSPITSHQSPTLLIIDQFEETFTLADAAEARAFLDVVHELIGQPNLHILLTVRADFYAKMMAMGDLWEDVQARRLELTPLGEDELWAAIVEPAARVGVEVEDALATALIADARGEDGVLPLVQETLVRLWDKVEGRQLKRSAYRQMADGGRSGIQVAINDHANDIYHTLPTEDRSIARRIFLRLIQFSEGRDHDHTRRQQTVAELLADGDDPVRFAETLRSLIDGRLLTSSGAEGDPNCCVDISHEALIQGWKQLDSWIQEWQVTEQSRRALDLKAREWQRLSKKAGYLDKLEIEEAEAWLATTAASVVGVDSDLQMFIVASKHKINPGWHPRGTWKLTVGMIGIVSLIAMLPLAIRMIDSTIQIVLYAGVGGLLLLGLWALGLMSHTYGLQHLSWYVDRQPLLQLFMLTTVILSIGGWSAYGVDQVRTLQYCTQQGYVGKSPRVRAAIYADNTEQYYVQLVTDSLAEHSEIDARVTSHEVAEKCNGFFTHQIEIRRESPPGGGEVGYAVYVKSKGKTSVDREAETRPKEQCDLFVELGLKAMQHLNVEMATYPSPLEGNLELQSCDALDRVQEGFAAYEQNRYEEAKQKFEQAIELEPGYATAYNNLGLVYLKLQDNVQAQAAFNTAVTIWPQNGLFQNNRGIALFRMERYAEAEDAYWLAIALEQQMPTAPHILPDTYINLSTLLRQTRRYTDTLRYLNMATELVDALSESQGRSYYKTAILKNRGILNYEMKNFSEAETQLEESLKMPASEYWKEQIFYYLARLAEDQKRADACLRWEDYFTIPNNNVHGQAERRKDGYRRILQLGCN